MNSNSPVILYAEDDLDDLFIIKQAFENYNDSVTIVHAHNGFIALEILNRLSEEGTLPCLIILDINMPGMNGKETLIRLKQSDKYKSIPVVLFTTSSSREDKNFAEKWGADFITKPIVYSDLEALAHNFVKKCAIEITKRA